MEKKRIIFLIEKIERVNRKELAKAIREKIGYAKLNDIRVATKHIEIDLFAEDVEKIKEKLKEFNIIDVKIVGEEKIEDKFQYAKQLFNSERFWETHEVLESVWRISKGDEKKILHGLILIAAAFVHYQKERKETCLSILKRAYEELKKYDIDFNGFDIKYIKNKIEEIIKTNEIKIFKII